MHKKYSTIYVAVVANTTSFQQACSITQYVTLA